MAAEVLMLMMLLLLMLLLLMMLLLMMLLLLKIMPMLPVPMNAFLIAIPSLPLSLLPTTMRLLHTKIPSLLPTLKPAQQSRFPPSSHKDPDRRLCHVTCLIPGRVQACYGLTVQRESRRCRDRYTCAAWQSQWLS
jgi:hypothetical protein